MLTLQDELKGSNRFSGGIHFIGLASISDYTLVIPTIARSFGILAEDDSTQIDRLIGLLQHRRTLLILDNLEHVLEASLDIARLHQACPDLTLIVTSRRAMSNRWRTGVSACAAPSRRVPPGSVDRRDRTVPAVALFLARATSLNPRFALTDANAKAIVGKSARGSTDCHWPSNSRPHARSLCHPRRYSVA